MVRDAKAGAITTINCTVNPQLNSGQCFYYDSCRVKDPSAVSRYIYMHIYTGAHTIHVHQCVCTYFSISLLHASVGYVL